MGNIRLQGKPLMSFVLVAAGIAALLAVLTLVIPLLLRPPWYMQRH
jgi:hypothetical protein